MRLRALLCPQAALKVGDKLSDYPDYYRVLQASDGSSVALSKYLNKNPLVVFFYPRAGQPDGLRSAQDRNATPLLQSNWWR